MFEQLILVPFVFQSQSGMENAGEGTHAIHPEFQLLQTFNKRERVKVGSEGCAVNPVGRFFDLVKNTGVFAQMDEVSQVIFVGSSGKPYIHLYDE
jgi:hypothetical protein